VPIALRAELPWGGAVAPHTLTSSFGANLFWLSWVPWLRLRATALPPMTWQHGEGRAEFAARVQVRAIGCTGLVEMLSSMAMMWTCMGTAYESLCLPKRRQTA
jgi:hypothetical protein